MYIVQTKLIKFWRWTIQASRRKVKCASLRLLFSFLWQFLVSSQVLAHLNYMLRSTYVLRLRISDLPLLGHGCSPDWSLRLYPYYSTYGVVHVCYGGIWRAACEYDWTAEEVKVVCNQLGYTGGCRKCIFTRTFYGYLTLVYVQTYTSVYTYTYYSLYKDKKSSKYFPLVCACVCPRVMIRWIDLSVTKIYTCLRRMLHVTCSELTRHVPCTATIDLTCMLS